MSLGFVYEALPMHVRFASGSLDAVTDELDRLGLRRVLVLATPEQRDLAERVTAMLGDRAAGVFAEARMHVPVEVARRAEQAAHRVGADGCVAVGGGSTIGLGKAIALTSDLPIIAVPTTYAGSEMTPIWGLTDNGEKRTGRDHRVLPASVVYDPQLTTTLPVNASVTSAVNAMAHAVEALYAPDSSPVISLMAEEGVRALVSAIPGIIADGRSGEPRETALYGAWLCGACLGATTMSLHHKICHSLGGILDLPHAPSHTVVLPHVLAYNQTEAPTARAVLSRVLGGSDPATRMWELTRSWGAPTSLRELGMKAEDIPTVVASILARPYANPRAVTDESLTSLLTRAWSGDTPQQYP
jgi:maleylacetate reductase